MSVTLPFFLLFKQEDAAIFLPYLSSKMAESKISLENHSLKTPNQNVDPTLILTILYYLHPGKNPRVILVSPPLNGENFHSWSCAMHHALLTKNKLKFVDGSLPSLTKNDNLFDAWERSNNIVVSWINRSLSMHIA